MTEPVTRTSDAVAARRPGPALCVFSALSALSALSVFCVLSVLSVLCALSVPLEAQSLARRLDARMDAPPFDRLLWGVAVVDDQGRTLYGRNERRLFAPASNAKLVVSAVAAALLLPDWTVRTSVYPHGPVVDGVVRGDLILYGRGDPTFDRRCYGVDTTGDGVCDADPFTRLRQLAQALHARGVREVHGDLVGDGSYFEPLLVHPSWEMFDLNWWYAAPVSGLGFNDNSLDFRWGPGATVGSPAAITMTPDLGDIVFENRTVTVPPGGRSDIGDRFYRMPGTLFIWAEGTVARDRLPRTESFALPDPNLFTARAFRQVLAEVGIAVTGTTRSTTDSMLYQPARAVAPLAEVTSRPLRDWVFPVLNTSQNWFAEMLLKQLGRQFGAGGSWEAGLAVERRFLIDSVGIDSTHFALVDGSGLSAANRMSPLAFTRLLRFMRGHPRFQVFAAALPQSGKPGSLLHRFLGTSLSGSVRAKTGSIDGVNTLAGYIDGPEGKGLTFSIEANNQALPARTILAGIDSLVVEMGRRGR